MEMERNGNPVICRMIFQFPPAIGGSVTHTVELAHHVNPYCRKQFVIAPKSEENATQVDRSFDFDVRRVNYLKWLPLGRLRSLSFGLFALKQILSLNREYGIDIIHAHSTYVVFNRVLDSLREKHVFAKIPILATIHGFPKQLILPNGTKTTDYDQLVSSCPFDKILGVSNSVANVLRKYLSPQGLQDRVETHYNGINTTVFTPQPHIAKDWDLAFFGRLMKMKSIDLFPKILSLLTPDFSNLRLKIIKVKSSPNKNIVKIINTTNNPVFLPLVEEMETS